MHENTKAKQYSIWSNCRYTFYKLRQIEGTGSLAICGIDVLLSILLPFLEAALAGAVTACLVSNNEPKIILLFVAGYIILLQTARFGQSHLRDLRHKLLFMFRVQMNEEYYQKVLSMDGQSLESAIGQKKKEIATKNLYSGNDRGIEAYTRNFLELFSNICGLILYGIIVGKVSLLLLLLLISQTAFSSFLHFWAGKRTYKLEDEIENNWQAFQYLRRESIVPENGKDIRIYQMRHWFLRRFYAWIDRIVILIDNEQTGFMAAGIMEKILSFGRNLLVYGYLIWEMAQSNMTLPSFLLYVGIVSGFEAWMNGLFEALNQILMDEKLMDGYRDFMDFGNRYDDSKPAPHAAGSAHEIRLENVSFRYEGSGVDTIQNLNLTIRPGEKLALVGLNGAGKTTLIKLLCGLYRPTGGKIYLDGQDLQTLSQEAVFKEFSVVFQEVFAFSFPLAANVSCSKQEQEDKAKLKESLSKAGLWAKIQKLPNGIRTAMNKDLDESGVTLSGGEIQKLMLARALYKDSPVVILDEPTAALDPIAESEMYEKYDELIQGKTSIFISHRLSSTRFCERILFMEKGAVIEEGSHESLMAKGGAYAELFTLQAKYYQQKKKEEEIYA